MSKQERRTTILKGLIQEEEQEYGESEKSRAKTVLIQPPEKEPTFTKRSISEIEK